MSCNEVLDEVATMLRPAAVDKGLDFALKTGPPSLTARTDRRALSQIVINLVGNAIKFTSAPGEIVLSLAQVEGQGQAHVHIQVSDTGCGIRPEDQARLFQAFGQVDAAAMRQQGSGLGLHLSQKLAHLLGGGISFTSQYGRGSTFVLTLPMA